MNKFLLLVLALVSSALKFGDEENGAHPIASFDREAADPRLFAPDVLRPAGRITLTPGFSPDGRTIFFAQTNCTPIWECPQRLMRSDRTATGWTKPMAVPLPQDARVNYPSVTPDGRYLLFSWAAWRPRHAGRNVRDDFDLWRLDLARPGARPVALEGPDLNRVRGGAVGRLRFVNNETAPIQTRDGDLYFWTERLDGPGERDVYRARADGAGGFLKPEPLGAPINSPGRDDGAWISADGATMLLTYADRGGCGGSDLFISRRVASSWSEPVNLGCRINSPFDELAATQVPGTNTIIFPSTRPTAGAPSGTVALWQAALQANLLEPRSPVPRSSK